MNNRLACTLATISLLVTACSREPAVVMETAPRPYAPTSLERIETLENNALRTEINNFEHSPTAVHAARVKKVFAELNLEFAELNELLATKSADERAKAAGKLAELRAGEATAQARFLQIETQASTGTPNQQANAGPAEIIGGKIDGAARKIRERVRDAAATVRDQNR